MERNLKKSHSVEAKNGGSLPPVGEMPVSHEDVQAESSKYPTYEDDQGLRRRTELLDNRASSILVDEKMEVPRFYGLR